MGRKKQKRLTGVRPGRGGTWIEIKTLKGKRYVYERTRVYNRDGSITMRSKYLYPLGETAPPAEGGKKGRKR